MKPADSFREIGLFETMRAYDNRIVGIAMHLKRLAQGARVFRLKLPCTLAGLEKLILKKITAGRLRDAYLKILLTGVGRGREIKFIIRRYQPYPAKIYKTGFRMQVACLRQESSSFFSRHKTTQRLIYELSFNEAKEKGFDEALLLNERGHICEGTRSSIFFVKAGRIFTPRLGCGCLDGITRRVVFALVKKGKIKISQGNFTLGDLRSADEAFLTNSLIGVMPLARVEKKIIGKARPGAITRYLMEKYNSLLKDAAREDKITL